MLLGFSWRFQAMHCVDFVENALFKSSGVICWSPPPSSLPGELSMDKRDSDGFFSTQKVCMVSHRSNNTTGSSRIVAHWQRSFLAVQTADTALYGTCTAGYYAIACNVHSCGYSWLQPVIVGSNNIVLYWTCNTAQWTCPEAMHHRKCIVEMLWRSWLMSHVSICKEATILNWCWHRRAEINQNMYIGAMVSSTLLLY